ncbi:hypothetical protein [Spongiibacter tropicus]|uniref:hypothetical protein n=1 Tax=Spongiibacter tropicus TaxID=454602 RepID=UPI0003B73FDC|nr:hypothetical protein [Spongiibacter tropicus]
MADFYAACTGGQFEQYGTLSGAQMRCTGTLENVTESELIEKLAETNLSQWLELIFSTPDTAEIQAAFMAGCTIPLIAWLTAWAYSVVIDFATRDHDNP